MSRLPSVRTKYHLSPFRNPTRNLTTGARVPKNISVNDFFKGYRRRLGSSMKSEVDSELHKNHRNLTNVTAPFVHPHLRCWQVACCRSGSLKEGPLGIFAIMRNETGPFPEHGGGWAFRGDRMNFLLRFAGYGQIHVKYSWWSSCQGSPNVQLLQPQSITA
jgi:hypothetical protein